MNVYALGNIIVRFIVEIQPTKVGVQCNIEKLNIQINISAIMHKPVCTHYIIFGARVLIYYHKTLILDMDLFNELFSLLIFFLYLNYISRRNKIDLLWCSLFY